MTALLRRVLGGRSGATLLCLLIAAAGAAGLLGWLERAVLPATATDTAIVRLEANMARAAGLFAGARAIDAAVSVAKSAGVSGSAIVAGGNITPGQVLEPIDDLVERFSGIMLTATVALGGSIMLLEAGDLLGLAVLLPAGLVLVALAPWLPGPMRRGPGTALRRAGGVLVLAAVILKLGVPLTVLATEAVADRLVEPRIVAAEARFAALDLPDAAADLSEWRAIPERVGRIAAAARDLPDILLGLTVAWLMKLAVLPLVTLWLVARLAETLITGLLPRGGDDRPAPPVSPAGPRGPNP